MLFPLPTSSQAEGVWTCVWFHVCALCGHTLDMCVESGAPVSNSNLGSCREGVERLTEDKMMESQSEDPAVCLKHSVAQRPGVYLWAHKTLD